MNIAAKSLFGVAALLAATAVGRAGIVNGDFEAGNVGFSTDYSYSETDGTPVRTVGVISESKAAVNPWNPNFATNVKGNGGKGKYLAVNGATQGAGPVVPITVWQETVAVDPDKAYVFSFYATSLFATSPASLRVRFSPPGDGQNVGVLTTVVPDWKLYGALWLNLGRDSSVTITISDDNANGNGNDFGIDDLKLLGTPSVPLPASTYGGLALLAGLVAARRHAKKM